MFDHPFPFDPTYGYDDDALLRVLGPEEPQGFPEFWQAAYDEAIAAAPKPTLRPVPLGTEAVEVFEVEYDGVGGFRVGGWLVRPRGVRPTRGVVMGHGYGGRAAPAIDAMDPVAVSIQPCARGFHRSARPDLPAAAAQHVVHGIASRETYLIRACVQDLWSAASALLELEPQTAGRVDYVGVSFGGGLGALALPWEPRFRRGFLGVPTFGNHPLRLGLPCVGSGDALTKLYARDKSITDVLAYFDSAVAARHIRIPVAVHAAPFDPAVPPPGQFAVYNELRCPKALGWTSADHFEYPNRAAELAELGRRVGAWFAGRRDDIGDCRLPQPSAAEAARA